MANLTQAQMTRAIKCAQESGLTVAEIILEPGICRLITIDPLAKDDAGNNDLPRPKEWPQK